MNAEVQFTAQDTLASIGFDAARVAAVIQSHAVGGPPPKVEELISYLDRMLTKAKSVKALLELGSNEMNMPGKLKVSAELEVTKPNV
jgi:hypothetical protein